MFPLIFYKTCLLLLFILNNLYQFKYKSFLKDRTFAYNLIFGIFVFSFISCLFQFPSFSISRLQLLHLLSLTSDSCHGFHTRNFKRRKMVVTKCFVLIFPVLIGLWYGFLPSTPSRFWLWLLFSFNTL